MFCLENWLIISVQSDLKIQIVDDSLLESNLIYLANIVHGLSGVLAPGVMY